ncbi:phage holin family protein [Paracraurococcus ruber]|uniref:Phage holin family protein n=1 Tax=Paracraurococcus ruber TaxID=77675 RepID=A0ABS1D1G2_9PROT|nr:phage holin family protein [Paracraurococcus ruber]MBK1660508.1 hypothetical protein [Paracraurococcus ruber]TDG27452.1 phage holin family protein [Paracraurococcus ruber]
MPSDIPRDGDRSLPELFGSLINQLSTLVRQEVRLARAEIGEKLGDASGAVTPIAAGGGLLLGALIVLLFALVSLLVAFGIAQGLAELIVGLLAALLGYGLVRSGLAQLKSSNLVPSRTTTQLSRDAQVAKEQVR